MQSKKEQIKEKLTAERLKKKADLDKEKAEFKASGKTIYDDWYEFASQGPRFSYEYFRTKSTPNSSKQKERVFKKPEITASDVLGTYYIFTREDYRLFLKKYHPDKSTELHHTIIAAVIHAAHENGW